MISITTFGLISSCNNDDDPVEDLCIINKIEFVTSINAPATGMVNQPIITEVKFRIINGCGQFGRFIQIQEGNTQTIEVQAKYVGCYCTQDVPTRTINYTFTPTVAGNYQVKFRSSETEFITANISVN